MQGKRWLGPVMLGACFALRAGPALAQPAAVKPKSFESSAGLKLLAGGNVWTAPSDVSPAGYEGLGFPASGGGFGWGAAAYYEARFVQHLGVEFDLGYDSSALQRNVTYNGVVDVTEKVTMSGLSSSRASCQLPSGACGSAWAPSTWRAARWTRASRSRRTSRTSSRSRT